MGRPLGFAFDVALGAGADELLDAPVSDGGSSTLLNGNGGAGGNGSCRGCVSNPNLRSLSFCGVPVGVVMCFPFPVIRRFASR